MRKANLLSVLASLIAAAAGASPQSTPRTTVEPWMRSAPPARGAALLRHEMLVAHAAARTAVGVAPLAWSDALAASALAQAQDLARSGRFDHGGRFAAARGIGENLWMGSRDGYSYAEMVAAWLGEGRDYINAAAPGFSRTGTWQDVGHYSQIVWRGTTEFGCAIAAGPHDDVLVCRYAPAGNVIGQVAF